MNWLRGADRPERAGRVLVVDDNEGVRTLIDMVLGFGGYDVATAEHGQAALNLVAGWQPDVILLDSAMPVMDGREFARQYRQLPGPHAPIIMLTAADDGPACAAEIGAAYLGKPFPPNLLLRTVEAQLRQNQPVVSAVAQPFLVGSAA
ncbi:MAG: response regulator [Chloroflexota bacterium]